MAEIEQRPDQTEEEFWEENDPYGERFSTPLPRWGCALLLIIFALAVWGVVRFVGW